MLVADCGPTTCGPLSVLTGSGGQGSTGFTSSKVGVDTGYKLIAAVATRWSNQTEQPTACVSASDALRQNIAF